MSAETCRLIAACGACELDLARRELRVLGCVSPLGGRAFEIVEILARARGELVTKDALMRRVWPGAVVMEATLHVHAAAIRKALGPYRALLKTESGRGYRLLGNWPGTAPSPLHQQSRNNLPAAGTRLIGRAAALRKVRDLLSIHRAVTLTGPGGIGKTSLALQAARRLQADFPGGTWLIELAALSEPALVASSVAEALGLALPAHDISAETVARAIGDRHTLLILDNCEHVIAAAAALADALLHHCPRATILATSREILRVAGEYAYRVPPLAVPTPGLAAEDIRGHAAPQLFITRARALGAGCAASPAVLQTIAAICRHLDGIPLAIEFAAARAVTLGVDQVAASLADRFALLTNGYRTAMPRHQTLYAACDWSYQLLPTAQQQAVRFLSVFPTGFPLTAATAVLADYQDRAAVSESISSLVEKSLLNLDHDASHVTYRMLETTRDYARQKLAGCGETAAAMQRLATYVRDIVGGAPKLDDLPHVRAALDWCFSPDGDAEAGLAITACYTRVWLHASLMAECRARVEAALARLPSIDTDPARTVQLYIALSIATVHTTGLVEDTQAALDKATVVAATSETASVRMQALWALWDYHSNSRDYAKALQIAQQLHRLADATQDRPVHVVANRLLGHSLHYSGRQAEARIPLERALQLEGQDCHNRTVWFQYDQRVLTGALLTRVLWLLGDGDQAAATVKASSAEAAALGHRLSQCYVQAMAAFPLACWTGDLDAAEQALDLCTTIANQHHLSFYQAWSRCLRGVLSIERGAFSTGLGILSDTLPGLGRVGERQPEFQIALAKGLAGAGDPAQARAVIDTALAHAQQGGEYWCIPELRRLQIKMLAGRL